MTERVKITARVTQDDADRLQRLCADLDKSQGVVVAMALIALERAHNDAEQVTTTKVIQVQPVPTPARSRTFHIKAPKVPAC